MKIRQAGAEMFLADGRTDGHDEANSRFRNYANAPKSQSVLKAVKLCILRSV